MAGNGVAGGDAAGKSVAGVGMAWQGVAGVGVAWQGVAWQERAWQEVAWQRSSEPPRKLPLVPCQTHYSASEVKKAIYRSEGDIYVSPTASAEGGGGVQDRVRARWKV